MCECFQTFKTLKQQTKLLSVAFEVEKSQLSHGWETFRHVFLLLMQRKDVSDKQPNKVCGFLSQLQCSEKR